MSPSLVDDNAPAVPQETAQSFRERARGWFESDYPRFLRESEDLAPGSLAWRRRWEDHVCASGWSGLGWPREWGGQALPLSHQAIFLQEQARVGAPLGVNLIGHGILAPTLLHFGSAAQKRRFLPRILTNAEIWCQGYSESGAGSDLASLACQARREGDDFVLTGHKIWTSFAQLAHWCFVLARTDTHAARHRGLSMLLVDMQSPGVRVEPIRQINGESEFNQVVFDHVRVPQDRLLGAENGGWQVAMAAAAFERGTYFIARQVRFAQELDSLEGLLAQTECAPAQRAAWRGVLDDLHIDSHVLRLKTARALSQAERGEAPGPQGSSTKIHWSEAHQRLLSLAMDMLGERVVCHGAAEGAQAPGTAARPKDDVQAWVKAYLSSRAETILAGTSEIQRNIIGEQILRMPKG